MRRLARLLLLLILAASAAGTTLTAVRIASDPLIAPYTEATLDQIKAQTEAFLIQAATPEALRAPYRDPAEPSARATGWRWMR